MSSTTFKNMPIKLYGAIPEKGSLAKGFILATQDLQSISLKDLKKGKKVFWVVPSLDTGVCLTSTKKLNDIAKKNPTITYYVISADLPFAQKRVCGLENLQNIETLSMMYDKEFGKDYGVLIENSPLKGLLTRSIFILDENNKIVFCEVVAEITKEPNYDSFETALK